MIIKELSHANAILSMIASFLERWNISTYQRESIQVFYLLLKVWNSLTLGQVFRDTSCDIHKKCLPVNGRLTILSKMVCISNKQVPTCGEITPLPLFII